MINRFFSFLMVATITISTAQAQYDPQARSVLDAMSNKYQSIPSFSADITYTLENIEDDLSESFAGKIGVKGDMFRLISDEQEIIIKGNTVWTYLSDANEVNIDNYEPEEDDVTPSTIYNIYKKGYKYTLFGETTEGGKAYNIIDLAPEDKDSEYFRIRLMIGKADNILKSFTLYAKSGNRYTYDISNFNGKANLGDSYFEFDESKYEGVEVIDLRIDN